MTPRRPMTGNRDRLRIKSNLRSALHCVHIAMDGLVYICERGSDRVQVFTKEGKFVSSFLSCTPRRRLRGPECGGPGSTTFGMCGTIYNLTFSHDAQQKYLLIADGTNDKIWIHDRKDGSLRGSIGDNGRMAGQFHWIDAIAMTPRGISTRVKWTLGNGRRNLS